jgi:uncharacterized membrane protein
MKRLLAFAALLLSSLPALAATQEEVANAPVPTVDMVYVVLFIVGFIAAVVGFFVYYYFYASDEENKDKN